MSHVHDAHSTGHHKMNPYAMLWVSMLLSFIVMYLTMFSMVDQWSDFHNNLNMVYMTLLMWAPMGLIMMVTMPGMYRNQSANMLHYALFIVVTLASLWAIRNQTLIGDRAFIASMIPHHSGAILMCREAGLKDAELLDLCKSISDGQRQEIVQMETILQRLK